MKWEDEGYIRKDDDGHVISMEDYEAAQAAKSMFTKNDLKLYAICGLVLSKPPTTSELVAKLSSTVSVSCSTLTISSSSIWLTLFGHTSTGVVFPVLAT